MKEEMSTLDKILPKYYKGYDIDVIIKKIRDNKPTTKEETLVYIEVWEKYHKQEFKQQEDNGDFIPGTRINMPPVKSLGTTKKRLIRKEAET